MITDRLQSIFDVFSRRSMYQQQHELEECSDRLRNRILILYRDIISGAWNPVGSLIYSTGNLTQEFWGEMHNALEHLYGRTKLSADQVNSQVEDVLIFLAKCKASEFLDFVELSFKLKISNRVMHSDESDVVNAINEIFRIEDAPYRLTNIVKVKKGEKTWVYEEVLAYPQIILAENEVTHEEAIAPALSILGAPHFKVPNEEFRDALSEYRKGHYNDCLTKCASAFESVLKILCKRSKWPFKERDTIIPLLKVIISRSSLEPFFEQPLTLIANLRNRLSSSHGAGNLPRVVEHHVAQYMISITAAAIVLLVSEVDK